MQNWKKKKKKKNSINISVFGYESNEKYPIYLSKKCCEGKKIQLLLIEEKSAIFLSKISIHSCMILPYIIKKTFKCHIKILKCHINDCFKINVKQIIKMPKEGIYVRLKNYEWKIKSPFIIDAYFERIWVPDNKDKQNSEESFADK